MSIGEICNREVIVTAKGSTTADAAKLMRQHHVGDLVVVEERGGARVPVGIVTDRDLVVEVLALGIDSGTVTIGDLGTGELYTAHEQDGIWDTLQRMRGHGVRRMPVVDAKGALAGIITVDDLLDLLAGELGDLVKIIRREQGREQEVRSKP